MTNIVWGPPIPITDGKKPEWLGDTDKFQWFRDDYTSNWTKGLDCVDMRTVAWSKGITSIRLPQDHSYYTGKTTITKYNDEVVERCVALVRKLSDTPFCNTHAEQAEARAIVALLEPVDPDVLEARNLVETAVHWSPQTDRDLASGKNDNTTEMKIALAALKRGRELAMKELNK